MPMLSDVFSADYYIQWMEILTIVSILVLVGYFFVSLNLFKKR